MMKQGYTSLLTKEEIPEIFLDLDLLERKSFFIIEEDQKGYDQNRTENMSVIEDLKDIKNAYLSGHSIVVKNLANYNYWIRHYCNYYANKTKREVDVCMFVSPPNGSTFGWHTDEEDVYIHGVLGKKMFWFRGEEVPKLQILRPQWELHIPPGLEHSASSFNQPSVHLSFGIKQKDYGKLTGLAEYALNAQDLGLV